MMLRRNRSAGTAISELLTQHSEATAVRDGSNLSNLSRKSNPLRRKTTHIIKQNDLAEMLQLRAELRNLTRRYNRRCRQIEELLRAGANVEQGKHWAPLEQSDDVRLLLDE